MAATWVRTNPFTKLLIGFPTCVHFSSKLFITVSPPHPASSCCHHCQQTSPSVALSHLEQHKNAKSPDRIAEQPAGQVPSAALLVKLWKPQLVMKIPLIITSQQKQTQAPQGMVSACMHLLALFHWGFLLPFHSSPYSPAYKGREKRWVYNVLQNYTQL